MLGRCAARSLSLHAQNVVRPRAKCSHGCTDDGSRAFRGAAPGALAGVVRTRGRMRLRGRTSPFTDGASPAPNRQATKCTREPDAAHPVGWAYGVSVRCRGPGLELAVPGLSIPRRRGSIPFGDSAVARSDVGTPMDDETPLRRSVHWRVQRLVRPQRFIASKNSLLHLVSLSLSSRNSIAASSSIGCSSLRRIHILASSP